MTATTLGVTPKTGWAALVGVRGAPERPEVVVRTRLELCPEVLPGAPYHATADLPLAEAAAVIEQVHAAVGDAATAGLRTALAEVGAVRSLAVDSSVEEFRDDLEWVRRSHLRWHAAEGELYREALADAAARLDLAVVRFPRGTALAGLAVELGRDATALAGTISDWGRDLGPPWRKEHKDAAAAAWLALALRSPS